MYVKTHVCMCVYMRVNVHVYVDVHKIPDDDAGVSSVTLYPLF